MEKTSAAMKREWMNFVPSQIISITNVKSDIIQHSELRNQR